MIGIGNPLRGDDGVGWHLADALGKPHLALHQLTPECAERLAACGRVLFIDAWIEAQDAQPDVEPGPVLRHLNPAPAAAAPGLHHHLDPTTLLWITEQLYGHRPEAWQLLIPATQLGHSETFSPALQALLPQAQALLHRWLEPNGASLAIEGVGRA